MTTINNHSTVQSSVLLEVKDLTVTFGTSDGDVTAVNALNFCPASG